MEGLRAQWTRQVQADPAIVSDILCCDGFWTLRTPMHIPYRALAARKGLRDLQKPDASSKIMNNMRFAVIIYLRPYLPQTNVSVMLRPETGSNMAHLSPKFPDIRAPTDRSIRVTVMP